MKKIVLIFCILVLFSFCGAKQTQVEKIIEDGVEIVINHLEPYKIKGEPSSLQLEELFTIDTERDEIAELGVPDLGAFDVDSEGNIYFYQGREHLVYKFDGKGQFIASFGKRGQGPGEIEAPIYLNITGKDEIPIQDRNRFKLFMFDVSGNLIKEIKLESDEVSLLVFYPLENGNFLKFRDHFDPNSRHRSDVLDLCNSRFEELKELDKCDYGQLIVFTQKKKTGSPRIFIYAVSNGLIYVGHQNRGNEILVYDMDGYLLRKIRKKYEPVGVSEEFKEILLNNFGRFKDRLIIPDKMPPFHYFFMDDEGHLYVKTYEEGNDIDEYIHDIYNNDGILIARASLPGYGSSMYTGRDLNRAKVKNQVFYCIREKESGYKELVAYKMIWQ